MPTIAATTCSSTFSSSRCLRCTGSTPWPTSAGWRCAETRSLLAWLALRRDQEAACDARVIQSREPEDRITYANVIASFAAGPSVALAAPMACPVLGDKSIIHRLRSLKMNQLSNRRRLAGRGLVVAALVALPMTASLSYAEPGVPAPPAPPGALSAVEAPLPPTPPAAPLAPTAPLAPPAPLAPLTWQANLNLGKHSALKTATFAFQDEQPDEQPAPSQEVHREVEKKVERKVERDTHRNVDRKVDRKVERKVIIAGNDSDLSPEERAELRRELRAAFSEMDAGIKEAMHEYRVAMVELREHQGEVTKVSVDCENGKPGESVDDKGKRTVWLCTSEVMASAIRGLKEARASIAADDDMAADIRAEVLSALDAKIAQYRKHKR